MRWLRRLSIRGKLIALMLITSGVTLVSIGAAVVVNQALDAPAALRQQLSTLALVIGSRSTGALVFNDRTTAAENLGALAAKSGIIEAEIMDRQGAMFARFRPAMAPLAGLPTWWPRGGPIEVSQPILLEGEPVGSIRIRAEVGELERALLRYALLVGGLMTGSLVVALVVSAWLQRLISAPILHLRQAMDRVSRHRDYDIRLRPPGADRPGADQPGDDPPLDDEPGDDELGGDELGALYQGFNDMLAQIQSRDRDLARYSSTLEAQVAARTAALDQANQRRIAWLENVARFLLHELKNNTVGVTTALDLIERRTARGDHDVYLARARRSIAQMRSLLDSVGNASTLEASFYKEPRERLDLGALYRARIADYQSIHPGQPFDHDLSPALVIDGNEARLVQLLDNLVGNAVAHCTTGSAICIGLHRAGAQAQLRVADQGAPLPEDRDRMFDLFVSLRPREQRRSDNFGLGLYVVKLIAESHGGQVEARDLDDGPGALFLVTLPLAGAPVDGAKVDDAKADGSPSD